MDNYDENKLRKLAERRVKERRDLYSHIIVYICINGFFVALDLIKHDAITWSKYLLLAWGVGLAIHIFTTISFLADKGDKVEREMEKLRKRRTK